MQCGQFLGRVHLRKGICSSIFLPPSCWLELLHDDWSSNSLIKLWQIDPLRLEHLLDRRTMES